MEDKAPGILQARILEWVAFPVSRESSQHRHPTQVSCIAGRFFTNWAMRGKPHYVIVQFSCSVMSVSLQPHGLQHARLPCLSLTPETCWMSIKPVMPSNHFILCPLILLLPSMFPSIRIFSKESAFPIRWPGYWSFSFSISLSNEYSQLISFRIDLLDLFAVQGTLKSLLQHQSSKASVLWCSAIFRSNSHIRTWLLEKQ